MPDEEQVAIASHQGALEFDSRIQATKYFHHLAQRNRLTVDTSEGVAGARIA